MGMRRGKKVDISQLFPSYDRKMELSDFLVRLELLGVTAAYERKPFRIVLQRYWTRCFKDTPLTLTIEESCEQYLKDYRTGYLILSKGERINSDGKKLKLAISLDLLYVLAEVSEEKINPECMKRIIVKDLEQVVGTTDSLSRDVSFVIGDVFCSNRSVNSVTFVLLRESYQRIKKLRESILKELNDSRHLDGARQVPRLEWNRSNIFDGLECNSLNYARVLCLMFSSLPLEERGIQKWEEQIQVGWKDAFGQIPCTEERLRQLKAYILSQPELDSINLLFRYSLREIQNERKARSIIVSLCVSQVLSRLPHNCPAELVVDEAVSLFSKFDTLSIGKEERDIEMCVARYCSRIGFVEESISYVFWHFAGKISAQFEQAVADKNAKDGVRRKYWEERLGEMASQIQLLERQVDAERVNTVYQIAQKLCGPGSDYLLSRLYCFVHQNETISDAELRILLNRLLLILSTFGLRPFSQQSIGCGVNELKDKPFLYEQFKGCEGGVVMYPGWSVAGDVVIQPVASENREGEKHA